MARLTAELYILQKAILTAWAEAVILYNVKKQMEGVKFRE
jgi:hypothetical protein